MSAKTQFDLHPDAESLNAFAERALAEGERGQIAAHLANCGRCRQVVFLAQTAATEEEQLASGSTGRSEKRRTSWFSNWWFVWAPAAALATVVSLAFYVHLRRAPADQEMARATQATSPLGGPQNEVEPPQPAERPLAASGAAVRKPEMKKSSAQGPSPSQVEPMLPAPRAVNELATQSATAESSEAERARQTEERASAEEKGARGQQEMHGTMQPAAAAPAFNAGAAPTARFGAMANKTSASTLSLYAALLPSGLPTVSTAKGSKVSLAVDKSGAVFASTDGGSHWENVVRQWSGQAVTVRTQARAPDVYELVNDQGQMWVSTDGRVWTAK